MNAEELRAIIDITLLSAARHDRPSFDCGLADSTTYYGGAMNAALKSETKETPKSIDWKQIHDFVVGKVTATETEKGFKASGPQFFTNLKQLLTNPQWCEQIVLFI